MNQKQRMKWEQLRSKGKKNFIIYKGILGWGIPTAILFTLFMSFMENYSLIFDKSFVEFFIIAIILFPAGGIVFGLWVWNWTERIYMRNIDK
ncbi:hypothetical protein SAMN04487895_10814 [Paenibacillus sophorae]|uniref:Uncharacterized protein n=1 Tax=Paenibacillus sophorae TaxID=1333845 RepID=A0A1H8Q0S2_9BACL|nr:hypothetical protein [Paenibacillus sophorae]QWU15322.1 hypothetical protein KP014_26140 [Paenibacillus sophorae]SEO47537.1 hypothetical protein SAMN04487895_10814 [Paenibacillus sophorae]